MCCCFFSQGTHMHIHMIISKSSSMIKRAFKTLDYIRISDSWSTLVSTHNQQENWKHTHSTQRSIWFLGIRRVCETTLYLNNIMILNSVAAGQELSSDCWKWWFQSTTVCWGWRRIWLPTWTSTPLVSRSWTDVCVFWKMWVPSICICILNYPHPTTTRR